MDFNKIISYIFIYLSAIAIPAGFAQDKYPIPVIFDTDMGNDVDDALALYMLFKYEDMGKCRLLCVAHNKDNPKSVVATDIFASRIGRSPKYCAIAPGTGVSRNDGWYLRELCEKKNPDASPFYKRSIKEPANAPESVSCLRKILAESDDNAVVYISVGFSTNLANLLKSKPDEISELSGRELFAKKVKYVSIMAGDFSPESLKNPAKAMKEFNVATDAESAGYAFENCPVPMYFSGFEFGSSITYPRSEIDSFFEEGHPIYEAYDTCSRKLYRRDGKFDWATFDMTSVLFVFEPEYIKLSEPGKVSLFDKEGRIKFTPSKDGLHKYFLQIPDSNKEKIRSRIIELARVVNE